MRIGFALMGCVLALGCGAQSSEDSDHHEEEGVQPSVTIREGESALTLSHVSETEVVGTFTTSAGAVAFSSAVVGEELFDVKFDRGGRVLASHVNWARLENDLSMSGGSEVSAEDRAILQALSTTLEAEPGNETKVWDNLVRQATLWGLHPEGRLVVRHITADEARGWTTLCNGTSYRNFTHDTGSHALQTEYLKYGPNETTNPCRARCGIGCKGIGTSAWTVDCGNHDRCEQEHSSGCGDEFTSASDDFSFAGNCKY